MTLSPSALRRARWRLRISDEDAYARAGKRRRWNKWRKRGADHRMAQVVEAMSQLGPSFYGFGVRAALARHMGISKSTMTRYVDAILWTLGANSRHYRPRRQPGTVISWLGLLAYETTTREQGYESLADFLTSHTLQTAAQRLGRSVRTVSRLKQALGLSKK